ncbi:MAG: hypothetical protein R2711_03840 [Acidimicrobiales bacterium]
MSATSSHLSSRGRRPFESRHLGPQADQQAKMLADLGFGSGSTSGRRGPPQSIRSLEGSPCRRSQRGGRSPTCAAGGAETGS